MRTSFQRQKTHGSQTTYTPRHAEKTWGAGAVTVGLGEVEGWFTPTSVGKKINTELSAIRIAAI